MEKVKNKLRESLRAGMAGIVFSAALTGLSAEPSLTSVTATPRYPWNGLVDVDVVFSEDVSDAYALSFTARDIAGGTNLPMATVSAPLFPQPRMRRYVWNARADLGEGFVCDRVTISADHFNPIWHFDAIPAVDPDDVWAPKTVYNDIQTVVSLGEVENPRPIVRCLNDEWNLDAKLGPNTLVSGASMLVRNPTDGNITRLGITNAVAVLAMSDTTNVFRIVTLDYETGKLGYDVASPTPSATAEGHFFSIKNDPRVYLDMYRWTNGYNAFVKSVNTDVSGTFLGNRHDGLYFGSSVCGYFPNGIPFTYASKTTYPSSYDKNTHAAIFHAGVAGTDVRQTIVKTVESAPKGVVTNSLYSFGKNMIGRYVVPLIDGDTYFTVGFGIDPGNDDDVWHYFGLYGRFSQMNGELFDTRDDKIPYVAGEWARSVGTVYSKGVAMPDGRRIFLGGTGHDMDGTLMMWYAGTNLYSGPARSSYNPKKYGSHKNGRVFDTYPSNHVFSAWNRRDVTCLLPNGKFCGVDEKLGLVVVNPLTGETYVASDDPVFKKGQMGCQLLPNGKVLIVPYDCENELLAPRIGLDRARAASACGKLYEVDFGFTRSFSVSTLRSPYVRVAECPPEPSGVKVGLHTNGGKLPGIYCHYYPQENPAYGTLPVPTRTGYTFRGWGAATNSTTFVKATDPVPETGVVLYAGWNANTYSVKFNANGGTGTMANESFTYGTAKALTANAFKRTGYTFQGWATSASGAKAYSDKQSVNNLTATAGGTVNLYAVWKVSGGVQLWANGPYWAECNVGASQPEEYGYYFWWGDTVGYKRNSGNSGWVSVKNGASFGFVSDNCPTYGKSYAQLQSAGYITASGNLTAAHDAATAYLGAPWRMPTDAECQALIDNCTTTWITTNGVAGRLVTGKGAYAYKSIFLPAAGYGAGRYCNNPGSTGRYWSSTQYSNGTNYAWHLDFDSGSISRYSDRRDHGRPVRPVRVFAK